MSVLLLLGIDVCFSFAQDSDAAAAIHISDPCSCFTQKAEGCCCCGRSSQCAQQSSVNGYAFLDWFILLKTRCISWCDALNASPRGAMGEEWNLSQSLLGRTNWPAVLVYVLCLSLCFLSQHARPDLPVVDVWSAAISFDIFPPPAVDRWNPKLPLTWGSAMGSLSVCSVPLLFLLPSPSCPSIFLTTFQASKRSYVRRSRRRRKMLWDSCPTMETPLTKRRRSEHCAVRQTVARDSSPSYLHLPGFQLSLALDS